MAALLLCGMTGGWSTPTRAQVGGTCNGGSGTTTFTCSTTAHTTYTVPGSGTFGANECPFLGNACPVGTNATIDHTEVSVTTTVTLGPGTTLTGPCQSQTFFVAAGTSNVNTNTHTETFVNCATVSTAIPTLSTWALVVMVALMVAGGLLALRRRIV